MWTTSARSVLTLSRLARPTSPRFLARPLAALASYPSPHPLTPFHNPPHPSAVRSVRTYATSPSSSSVAKHNAPVLNLPTILTLARVAAIPALAYAFLSGVSWGPAACTYLFLGASLTDWLDGYLARKWDMKSAFGAFLDPVADKLMVTAVLLLLSTTPLPGGPWAGNTWFVPVCSLVVIGREIAVSALREWAASMGPDAHKSVAVNNLGKWKTTAQMTSLTALLILHQGSHGGGVGASWVEPLLDVAGWLGPVTLGVAALLTAWSMVVYFRGTLKHMV